MSRGLGKTQRLVLKALQAIEAERGEGYCWRTSYILQRIYDGSPELQEIERRRSEIHAAREAHIQQMADQGDWQAKMYLVLGTGLRMSRSSRGRKKEREVPFWLDGHLNVSRALASLRRRGLVKQLGGPGGGWAGLTDAGRSVSV